MTAQEALAKWDAGEPVWTVEMGGLGPGYEQCIQILAWEIVRDNEPLPTETLAGWGEAAVTRCNDLVGGFSGAQVGAAKHLALHFLREGYDESLAHPSVADRKIQVSKAWSRAPEVEARRE